MYIFLFETAPDILRAQQQYLLLQWLQRITFDTASLKIMKLRLHYERRTWPQKHGKIQELCQNVTRDFETVGSSLRRIVSSSSAVNFEQITNQVNTLLRQDLVEIHRLLGYEVRYSQCVATEFLIRTANNPSSLRRSIIILQECLQTTQHRASLVLERLRDMRHNMAADTSSRFSEIAEDCQTMYVRILAEVTALHLVIQLLRGTTAGGRPNNRGPLASVPIVRRAIRESTNLQRAALQAYSQISDRKVQRIIRTWLNILSVNEDLRNDTRSAIDEVEGGPIAGLKRAREEQKRIVLALQYLDRQDQLEANRKRGLQTTAEDDQVDTELLDAMDDSGIADMHGHLFTEDEQGRLKRRRIS